MINNQVEYILASAVHYDNFPLLREEVLRTRGISPYNIDRGIVFSGWRHANCIYQAFAISGKHSHELGKYIQGFLTSKNRFLDRIDSIFIAYLAGQIDKDKFNSITQLHSEDLW